METAQQNETHTDSRTICSLKRGQRGPDVTSVNRFVLLGYTPKELSYRTEVLYEVSPC